MKKEIICGKAFEDLTPEELVEYDGGVVVTVTALPVSTPICLSIAASVSVGLSVYYTIKD